MSNAPSIQMRICSPDSLPPSSSICRRVQVVSIHFTLHMTSTIDRSPIAHLHELILQLLNLGVRALEVLLQDLAASPVALAEQHKVRKQRKESRDKRDGQALRVRVRLGEAETRQRRVHVHHRVVSGLRVQHLVHVVDRAAGDGLQVSHGALRVSRRARGYVAEWGDAAAFQSFVVFGGEEGRVRGASGIFWCWCTQPA